MRALVNVVVVFSIDWAHPNLTVAPQAQVRKNETVLFCFKKTQNPGRAKRLSVVGYNDNKID